MPAQVYNESKGPMASSYAYYVNRLHSLSENFDASFTNAHWIIPTSFMHHLSVRRAAIAESFPTGSTVMFGALLVVCQVLTLHLLQ